RRPLILEVNAPLADEHAAHRGLAFADAARGLERLALGSADRLIAVSRELESWLVGLGVPRHRISVHANGVDVARFAAPSVAVAPYDHAERFYFSPLKLYEYMAAGLPVVAADVGAVGECVRHGATGWLYPPGDVTALAHSITALVARPELAASLGRAAREHV